jgi:hypothetical protein
MCEGLDTLPLPTGYTIALRIGTKPIKMISDLKVWNICDLAN